MASKDEYIGRLVKAIRDLHGVEAIHLGTDYVKEVFRGQTVWEGDVEVFRINGHASAGICYAWSYQESNAEHFAAVLRVSPVNTAQDAVKVHIVGELKKQKSN